MTYQPKYSLEFHVTLSKAADSPATEYEADSHTSRKAARQVLINRFSHCWQHSHLYVLIVQSAHGRQAW